MKKMLLVLPIVALSLFALPALSYAQGNISAGNTTSDPMTDDASQSGNEAGQGN